MSVYCTIFAPRVDYGAVIDTLRVVFSGPIEIEGPEDGWSSINLRTAEASLTFNNLVWQAPGDEFSKVMFGTGLFISRISTDNVRRRSSLVTFVNESEWIIGVVGDPTFEVEDDLFGTCIGAVAGCIEGIVFNGRDLYDSDGNLLLSMDGRWDDENERGVPSQ